MYRLILAVAALAAALTAAPPETQAFRRTTAWIGTGQSGLCESAVKVEGKPSSVVRCLTPADGLMLFVVADLTGDLTLITEARDALAAQFAELPAHVWTAALSAQDGLHVLSDPGPDPAATITAIRNGRTTGAAGLLEAMEPASKLASAIIAKSPVRIAILHISDSNIYGYREDYTNPVINYSDSRDLSRRFPDALIRERTAKLAANLAGYDAPVFVVHLAYLRDRLNEAYQLGLRQAAEATGGSAVFCRSQAEISTSISAALARILSHHALDFSLPTGLPRQFTIELAAPGLTPEYRSRFALGPK
ncbi:MAG TPA: hypothetical protein PKJ41_00995 [Bryobacteraceae bacterium]|nr:hypothetical protein [Bryobacteraceae bacterium]HPT26669.1 hypothetical protein [Bryobacteraceae bacterium]